MKELEEKFKNIHLLQREERLKLIKDLEILRPDFIKPFFPKWWWWKRCNVNVLIVTDGGLDFGTGGFGLSEFLTAFNQLQATTWNNYRITLGHRSTSVASMNPLVVNQINNFNFRTSVTLNDYDQVWLFGINSGPGLDTTKIGGISEQDAVETYMNNGGGLFATGDHGVLGSALCGNITRVKDMRHWADNPVGSSNSVNEVSMTGRRRNDTNRPAAGDATSLYFDNQSDNIPQIIAPRTFGAGLPHPLLSISASLRPSRVIDIMPDHPHEGECKPETTFTVAGVNIPTQNIATSFVSAGSTTNGGVGGKALTDPHSFPSIAVWDGFAANAGRIVVDSTWHHFVNINLNGEGSQFNDIPGKQSGFDAANFNVIRQYYMNIATWMTRRKPFACWRRFIIFDLYRNSQLIEASLDNPALKREKIAIADLNSIGSLAEEILSSKYNPAFARTFLLDLVQDVNPNFSNTLDVWKPDNSNKKDSYYQPWINADFLLWTAIGAGFIALRDDKRFLSEELPEKDLEKIPELFKKGMAYGFETAVKDLSISLNNFACASNFKIK